MVNLDRSSAPVNTVKGNGRVKIQYACAGAAVLDNFVRAPLVRPTGSFQGFVGAAFLATLSIKELRQIHVASVRLSGRRRASGVHKEAGRK